MGLGLWAEDALDDAGGLTGGVEGGVGGEGEEEDGDLVERQGFVWRFEGWEEGEAWWWLRHW